MMVVATVALAANVACLWLVTRHREGGAHMKASVIFSANDVIANAGVIVAGLLVSWTGSRYPDLVVGAVIAVIVGLGARRILRLQ
jgi:Co/Zn/Cd efflux system component